MTTAPADSTFSAPPDPERELSNKLHDLRTPLNQIIGLSEMLVEIAEEDGHRDLLEGLGSVREAGIELAALLQDRKLIAMEAEAGAEYWQISDATRSSISRVIGFTELVLNEPAEPRMEGYLDDLRKIGQAARNFVEQSRASRLLIKLESNRHWDTSVPVSKVAAGTGEQKGRILIVDDEALNREVLIRRLQREGYRPTGARSGAEALQLVASEPFDAVLLDLQMPEMSGVEVLQTLKEHETHRHLPVIMLSAHTDVEKVARCVELGAEDYLPKPINAVLLRARLGACLEKKELRDQERAHFDALHEEKERLSVTLRSLADAVVTTDEKGQIILSNDVAVSFTGVSSQAAQGKRFSEVFRVIRRNDGQPAASIVEEALSKGSVIESEPGLALSAPDGQERLISLRAAPIHDQSGSVRGTVVVVRDITEKEKMAEELLRTSKLQSIGVLAGGLAHDFNNMLTAVLGNLSLIRHRRNLPPEVIPTLNEAERGASRAQELTRYLLTFADGGAPMKQLIQVRSLIEETSAFVVRGSNVHCDFQLAPDLWDTEADPNQFAQVISNLVMNAVEAMPEGGHIEVVAENVTAPIRQAANLADGDYISISVQDYGVGIFREHLSRIYDPFFTTKKQARGLGLAAAYSIIQRHGGHITVESAPGVGTTITFYLPAKRPLVPADVAPAPAPAAPIADEPQTTSGGRKVRVLVMDDEEAIRLLIETMLDALEYEVVCTVDGDSALAAHAEAHSSANPFDLVIMDLTIPGGMGGKEAIRRLRERDKAIRAIVSSGYSNDPVMAQYHDYGFDGVLPKPYMMKDLIRVLQQVLPV